MSKIKEVPADPDIYLFYKCMKGDPLLCWQNNRCRKFKT